MNSDLHRLHLLFCSASDGTLTLEEHAELQECLRQDAEARCLWFLHQDVDDGLHDLASTKTDVPLRVAPGPVFQWLSWRPFVAVAALALAGVIFWGMRRVDEQPRPRGMRADKVATLLFSEGCEWLDGMTLADGQPLGHEELHLKRGMAIVRFEGGAEMALSGETSVELDSRSSVRVNRGQITVRINEESLGFRVRTPSSDLTDQGTEFEVKVGERGETELHVLDGAVSYAQPGVTSEDEPQVTAGHALRFAATNNTSPQAIAFDARPFAEVLRGADMAPRMDQLLAYEPFDYGEGRLPLEQAVRGHGWAGAWQVGRLAHLPAGNPGDMWIATDRIHAPWPVEGGRRGMLEVDGEFRSRMRNLAHPVRLDRDGIYYLSMMVRWEVPPEKQHSKDWRFLRLALRSSSNYAGDRITLTLPAFLRPQVQTGDGLTFTSPAQVRVNEAQLWCAKIVARAEGEDELSFRIYGETDTLDFAEPAFWHITSHGTHSDAVLDQLILASGGLGTAWFDEVRIATNWRSVMPSKLQPR